MSNQKEIGLLKKCQCDDTVRHRATAAMSPLSSPLSSLSRLGLDWDAAAPIQIRPWTSLHLPKEEGEREVILGQCLIINGDQTEEHLRGNPKRNLSRITFVYVQGGYIGCNTGNGKN